MKRCPDCKAPNPERLSRCYACGVRLDAAPRGELLPGEKAFPCANCGEAVSFRAGECPHCGLVFTNAGRAARCRPVLSPPGWKLDPLPDNTLYLRRPPLSPLILATGLLLIFGLLWGGSLLFLGPVSSALQAAVVTLALWLGAQCREELRVGPNWLERRVSLFGWTRARRITDALLTVQSREYSSRETTWRLVAAGKGGKIVLDTASGTSSAFSLWEYDGLWKTPPQLIALGEALAAGSGWNFSAPGYDAANERSALARRP